MNEEPMDEEGWAGLFDRDLDPAILRAEAGISQLGEFASEALFDKEFDLTNPEQLLSVHPDHPAESHVSINWMVPEPAPKGGLTPESAHSQTSTSAARTSTSTAKTPEGGVVPAAESPQRRSTAQSGSGSRGRGRGRARTAAATPAVLANRRYYTRRKEKEREISGHKQELEGQVAQLRQEKWEAETKNKWLVDNLDTWSDHLGRLVSVKEVRRVQQCSALQKAAEWLSTRERTFTLEDAMQWTVQEYVDLYQVLIERVRGLCASTLQDPASRAMQLLEETMRKQVVRERPAFASCFYGSMVGYNLQLTRSGRYMLPNDAFWQAILEGMRLSKEQEEEILHAYRWMHEALSKVAYERNTVILPQLGYEALEVEKDQMHLCPTARLLYLSLRDEQTVVLGFQIAVEKVLTIWQEAFLESHCYPWSPQWLVLCSLIFQQRGEDPLVFRTFDNHYMDLPILPGLTAFQLLEVPMLGLGVGMRGRHATFMCPFRSLLSKNFFPYAPHEIVSQMKLFDLTMGTERMLTTWGWMQKVKEVGRLVPNPLVEPK